MFKAHSKVSQERLGLGVSVTEDGGVYLFLQDS